MAKNLNISILLDFYGEMLTPKQKEVVELYYNEDLSLAEIAEHSGITRQGVRDSIKRAENQLLDCEARLRLRERFQGIKSGLDEISNIARSLQEETRNVPHPDDMYRKTQRIIELASELDI